MASRCSEYDGHGAHGRIVQLLVLLSLLGALFLVATPLSLSSLLVLGLWSAVALALRARQSYLLSAFAALVPIAPWFGSGTLLALALVLLLVVSGECWWRRSAWAAPWLLLLFASALSVTIGSLDFAALARLATRDLSLLRQHLSGGTPEWYATLLHAFRWSILVGLLTFLASDPARQRSARRGLLVGTAGALLVWALGVTPLLRAPEGLELFWQHLGRGAGTFSDPNAAGVFLALLLPLVWVEWRESATRWTLLVLVAAVLIAGGVSGSRTFVLGVAVLLGLLVLRRLSRRSRVVTASGAVVCLGVWNLLPLESALWFTSELPNAAARVLRTLHHGSMFEELHSRAVFSRIALAMFRDHPVFGVGFQQFRGGVAPYADLLATGSGLWADNANNFYLGLLAECGVFGLLIAGGTVLAAAERSAKARRPFISSFVALLAVLLLTGPHLEFDEVAILVAIGAAPCVSLARGTSLWWGLFAVLIALVYLLRPTAAGFGWYAWEHDGHDFLRWSGPRATLALRCDAGQAQLRLRAPRPPGVPSAGVVLLSTPHQVVEWDTALQHEYVLQLSCGGSPVPLRIVVPHPWMPVATAHGADPRLLGVQAVFERPAAALLNGSTVR